MRILGIGFFGNIVMFAVELGGGMWSGSWALVADSLHLLGDAAAMGVALWADWFSRGKTSAGYTFGREKSKALAAVISVSLLTFIICWSVVPEAVGRILAPQPVMVVEMFLIGVLGLAWNAWLGFKLRKSEHAHHLASARLHVELDLAASVFVVIAAILTWVTGWPRWDAVASVAAVGCIAGAIWPTFSAARDELLDKAPPFPWEEFEMKLRAVPGLRGWHDMHLRRVRGHWSMTMHVESEPGIPPSDIDLRLEDILHRQFGVSHHTIRIESEYCGERCVFAGHVA